MAVLELAHRLAGAFWLMKAREERTTFAIMRALAYKVRCQVLQKTSGTQILKTKGRENR
ncbi:hypothetical protein FP2506_17329 [Fulvimarina pelagi HTCC2506]|uniref:Uncharacterized protein n=1 Tax=Fulvimarina pelagi HTCC2506 TaxID=314231 RepID=Q0FY82_9HYPH|nr:hypothetical protein FP2506_17329 [Fulvimarina pelagi HTCC2506]